MIKASFLNLRPTHRSISIRLPADMLDELKILANKRDVPYQSLAKLYLAWGNQHRAEKRHRRNSIEKMMQLSCGVGLP